MTFLHKLSRRIASVGPLGGFTVVAALACSTPEEREFLSPNPGQPGSGPIVSVAVSPEVATLRPGEQVRFTARAATASGSTVATEFDWAATGGTMDPDGTFTSPINGLFSVTARVRSAPHIADSARVSVYTTLEDVVQVRVSPDSSELVEGEGLQLSALSRLADGRSTASAPLHWTGTGGQVDGSGWFTAPLAGDYLVLATAQGGAYGFAAVRVKPRGSLIASLNIDPTQATLETGRSRQFSAIASYWDGSEAPVNVSWSATGGSVSGSGLYTAGGNPGVYRVIARYKNGSFADTALVTVTAPTIVSVDITPAEVSIAPNGTQQYAAIARMSDGSTKAVGANWRASGGTISTTGLYTATVSDGHFNVIGEVAGTSLSDTSDVTVSSSAVPTQIILNPSSVSLPAGAGRQFSVSALYSDGSTRTPAVSYAATGGSVSAGGLYTAGAVPGNYRLIAVDDGSGKADTSLIVVTAPTLTQLSLEPASLVLQPGQTAQMTVQGEWSDGGTTTPLVSYDASGGTISGSGLYTAGPTTGSFRIVALHSASGLADTSWVSIEVPPPVLSEVTLSPASVTLAPAGVQQFAVSGRWSDGTIGVPPVVWSASGGTVSTSGLYTAPSGTGTFRVVATHASTGKADTSTVTVAAAAPVLTGLSVTPTSASIQTLGSKQFYVSATWSDGATRTPTVTWSANGGTVTNGGLYVAGPTAGTYQVTAAATGTSLAASAPVTVTAPPTITSLAISPSPVTLAPGQTQQFTVVANYSNGGTGVPQVTWSATGGSITAAGLFTAGQTTGSFMVVALCGCGVADTTAVAISIAPPSSGISWPNEPSGLTLISTDDWSAAGTWQNLGGSDDVWTANGWTRKTHDLDVVPVSGLPTGTARALQIRTPAGTVGGYGPWAYHNGETSPAKWGSGGYREVYFGYWTRIAATFVGHPSGSNKHANIMGMNPFGQKDSYWAMPWFAGTTTLAPLRFDASAGIGIAATTGECQHTWGSAANVFKPGQWQRVELWYRKPLARGATGEWKVWVDGVLVMQRNDVCDHGYGSNSYLNAVGWHGTWGGTESVLPTDNIQHFGPYRISGKR